MICFSTRRDYISWKSAKQTLISMYINHSKIIALYEASQESTWLCRVIDHIQISCGIGALESPMIIYEDNAACVAQMQIWYIKTNYIKHISPNLFYPHELQEHGEISILQIKSCDNHADLFTKLLPLTIFDKCVKDIGILISNPDKMHYIILFFFMSFTRISHWKIFNEAMCTQVYIYLLIFSTRFLHRDVGEISVMIVFLLNCPIGW
jgi:uncharacterized membrane protein